MAASRAAIKWLKRRRTSLGRFLRRHRLVKPLIVLVVLTALVTAGTLGYYYVRFSAIIDARLAGERDRVLPRVFARPLTFNTGQVIGAAEVVARLNDVGYSERARVEGPGEFAVVERGVVFQPRGGDFAGRIVQIAFAEPPARKAGSKPPATPPPDRIGQIRIDGKAARLVSLDPPLLTGIITGPREKRRRVALEAIPERVRQAVLAIEDRRFYYHPGIDPIRIIGAVITNITGQRGYLVGASTITQQLARNFFLTEQMAEEQQSGQRSWRRKILEQFMSLILETKATKDEILELYLNDVYLGHRGSFALHGVAEAARMFFGKDVTNLTLPEAALVAGVIQSPYNHSPFTSMDRARERRNVVLRAMADADYISAEAATRASDENIVVVARALDNEAPYFVDYMSQALDENFPGITARSAALDIYTTLDLNFQRAAQDAVRDGLARVDEALARRKTSGGPRRAQAALVAVDPRTGDILAMVGGRSYNQSQFNRAVQARRQPGSTFKPFVYLAAFEQAVADGRTDLSPATLVWDEPTTWTYNDQEWAPKNYEDEYDGQITLRRALALSRNMATIKIAEQTGFDRVAALWNRTGLGTEKLRGYPSIALGVSELSPVEVATAYTLFANHGTIAPLRALLRVVSGEQSSAVTPAKGVQVARPDTTFLVTSMMRSVLNEGTGAGARAAGFALDAAGKSGTTNDLRDAWFVGFTPDLLAVVWVGLDDNQPLGMSGSQAGVPIWTSFMLKALAGRANVPFEAPEGIVFAEIDRDTGRIATPNCPRTTTEAFLAGSEPAELCPLHNW
ncbi:MAG: PBP1A family penicillin-binding protein [Acidobacteria bacterium]|nr:PBP1A family penicillin-binding protein [Acidobacteriota bacterium]